MFVPLMKPVKHFNSQALRRFLVASEDRLGHSVCVWALWNLLAMISHGRITKLTVHCYFDKA